MFYVTGFGSDVLNPKSPLTQVKESIALNMAAEEFGGRYFSNGTVASGVFQNAEAFSGTAYDRLNKNLKANNPGLNNVHKTIILDFWHPARRGNRAETLKLLEQLIDKVQEKELFAKALFSHTLK